MSETPIAEVRITSLGDRALIIELGDDASEATALRVRAATEHFLAQPLAGVVDVVPAVCTLALHYDPLKVEHVAEGSTIYAVLAQQVSARLEKLPVRGVVPSTTYEVPVCYGGAFGEDLESLAQAHELSADDVIALHTAPLYRVQMLGFAPGFAYLAGLDAALVTPRKPTPRTSVPAGSVAIGGELTGIYPLDLPGGWHIIGRSPVRLFDPAGDPPTPFTVGDRVRFNAVTPDDYQRLLREGRWH